MSEYEVRWCPAHQRPEPAAGLFCTDTGVALEPMPVLDKVADDPDDYDDPVPLSRCWQCRTDSHDPRNHTCANCHESLVPPDLAIIYGEDRVVALDRPSRHDLTGRSSRVELGRSGAHGYLFERYLTVSRRHAVVDVDDAGIGWVEPIPEAPNGTWLNNIDEIFRRTELFSASVLRFGKKGPEGRVRHPSQEAGNASG